MADLDELPAEFRQRVVATGERLARERIPPYRGQAYGLAGLRPGNPQGVQ
ncbi:MAG: hypothetical protein ABI658_27775 [Acidimicrobiales bacterium]